jgi:hypothetical protein
MSAGAPLRVLFCIGVMPAFFDAKSEERSACIDAIKEGFDDLSGRFGITVLATFDDDRLMVGSSTEFPWTSYIIADAPDLDAAVEVCNILRTTDSGEYRLWRYLRIEARVGQALFFGTA